MKKQLLKMSVAALMLSCTFNSVQAQWNLTGNAGTGTSFLGTTNNFSLRLRTNNVQRMIVDSLGRVGIGTAVPSQLLTVQSSGTTPAAKWISSGKPVFAGYGEGTAGNADFNLLMASSTATSARGVFGLKRSRGTLAVPTAVATNDQLGSLLVSGFDGTNFQGSAAVDFYADGTPTAGNVPARISFVTGSNSTTRAERLRIGNTGDITMNTNQFFLQKSSGNVGIGTASPVTKLEVRNDNNSGTISTVTNKSTGSNAFTMFGLVTDQANGGWLIKNSSTRTTDGGANTMTLRNDGGDLRLQGSNGTGVFVQGSDGNVGIGNANPLYKLQVTGNASISNAIHSPNFSVITNLNDLVNAAPWYGMGLSNKVLQGQGGTAVQVGSYWGINFQDRMGSMVYSNGQLGIGTDNPQAKLHVDGDAILGKHVFTTDGIEVNINKTGDRYALVDLHGDDTWTDYSARFLRAPGANAATYLEHRGTGPFYIFSHEAAPITFLTNTAERMKIDENGNVAIGAQPSAGYLLTVAGKVICTELKVQVQPFPDYVFDKKYNLRSIAEVEKHINDYHRLPGMPAATEVEKDGMSVGEMQTKLVEKVEELTLYIIAQQKQIDELKAQMRTAK